MQLEGQHLHKKINIVAYCNISWYFF